MALGRPHVSLSACCILSQKPCSPIYVSDKEVSRQPRHRSHQEAVHCAGQEAVAEEEQSRHEALDVKLHKEEVGAVQKYPNARGCAGEERGPPPMVVL